MACTTVALSSLAWTAGTHPLERKKTGGIGMPILIEFAPGFRDPETCTRGHVIYVLRGVLGLELDGERRQFVGTGDCCVLDEGTAHRAFTEGSEAVELFIVSDRVGSRTT
jgi:quercetin dioxygenase-like cupin family protein